MTFGTTRVAAALTALLLAGSGCAAEEPANTADPRTSSTPQPAPSTSRTPDGRKPTAQPSVPEVLDFSARTVAGDAFAGADLAGKPVLLWFWAPWCAVCRSQLPMVEGLASTYSGRVAVVGIGSLDSSDAIADFASGSTITQLADEDGALWRRFGVTEQSSFVLLDAQGEQALRTGYADDDAVPDAVDSVTR